MFMLGEAQAKALLVNRSLSASMALSAALASTSVNCTNSSVDAGLIQSAVNNGGNVTLAGTCSLSNGSVSINNAVNISGPANAYR